MGDDPKPHAGLVWEKVCEMNLPEKDLVDSFDNEEDFVNYLGRPCKMDFKAMKAKLAGTSLEAIKEKAQTMGSTDKKSKAKTLADLKARVKELEAEDAAEGED